MSRETMIKKLGLTEKDLKPNPNDSEQRLADIEDALIELAGLIAEESNG